MEFTPEELVLINQYTALTGMIKKKRPDTSWLSKLDASVDRYFKFWCKGKYFVYYDTPIEKLKVSDIPGCIIFVKEIEKIEDSYKGKKGHFFIKLKNHDLWLKCDKKEESDKWVKAITFFYNLYQNKKVYDQEADESRGWKDDVDVRI
jgi:hypothetical protein